MKEEIITTPLEDVKVWEKPIPTKIPKGKTPVRGVGITRRKSTSENLYKVIYDKVLFIDTEELSDYYKIQNFVGNIMTKLNLGYVSENKREGRPKRTPLEFKCLDLWGCGLLRVHFNVFNIEENKWEGFDVRKGTE